MRNLVKSLRLTLVFCVFFSICYILVLWIFGLIVGPGGGNAETLVLNGRVVGAANVGQQFTKDVYFWGRPSHAGDGYDASSSSGSNKGPTNEEYLADVNIRIDSFLKKHPYLERNDVPSEMVTASASGLDPHITPESAYVQVKRVAKARGMTKLAKDTGLGRESLYKALAPGAKPRYDTIIKLVRALGVELHTSPIHASQT